MTTSLRSTYWIQNQYDPKSFASCNLSDEESFEKCDCSDFRKRGFDMKVEQSKDDDIS